MTRTAASNVLPYVFVEEKIGRALFKDEWIKDLTHRERWLLERDPTSHPASIIPARITAFDTTTGREWEDVSEFGRAKRKREFMEWQRIGVAKWLEDNDVDVMKEKHQKFVDKVQFEAAFTHEFPSSDTESSTAERRIAADHLQQEIDDWARNVCEAVERAGKRISKGQFASVAWKHFGNASRLTDKRITAAWRGARLSTGWPNAGTIPTYLKITDDDLLQLLLVATLMRPSSPLPAGGDYKSKRN